MNKKIKMPEYMSNGSVSGNSCAYRRLAVYNNCANMELPKNASSSVYFSASDKERDTKEFVYTTTKAPTTTAAAAAPVAEGYAEPNYKPSYTVPEYRAITTDALTHGGKSNGCGGYFNIMDAYGDDAGNCNVSYIKM